jgi:hypothetical protein
MHHGHHPAQNPANRIGGGGVTEIEARSRSHTARLLSKPFTVCLGVWTPGGSRFAALVGRWENVGQGGEDRGPRASFLSPLLSEL